MSPRRAVNEVFMHLLARYEHKDACKPARCVAACDVAGFLAHLEEPLLLGDVRRQEREAGRLAALVKGDIPEAG